MRSIALALALVGPVTGAVPACDRSRDIPPTHAPDPEAPGAGWKSGDAPFVTGAGRGATQQEATARAREDLAAALLGDRRWATLVGLDVHRSDRDATLVAQTPDGIDVRLGLTQVRAAAVLSEFEHAEPRVVGPETWRDTLYGYLGAHVAAHACEERRRLFKATCETGDTTDVDDALADLTTEVELSRPFPDGIPADADGRLLRPASVYVLWRGLPVAGVPVVATIVADETRRMRATSDASGVARFEDASAAKAWTSVEVAIDAEAMLGPLVGAWPQRPVRLEKRRVDARRWTAMVADADPQIAAGLDARLRERGAGSPAVVAPPQVQAILAAEGDARSRKIVALADAMSGRIDVVFVARASSRYASRMGTSKVWFEASGEIHAYDAWSGRVLVTVKDTATASGVGDERADRAARRELAEKLADRLLSAPEIRVVEQR